MQSSPPTESLCAKITTAFLLTGAPLCLAQDNSNTTTSNTNNSANEVSALKTQIQTLETAQKGSMKILGAILFSTIATSALAGQMTPSLLAEAPAESIWTKVSLLDVLPPNLPPLAEAPSESLWTKISPLDVLPPDLPALAEAPSESLWTRKQMLGDLGRSRLEQMGITIFSSYLDDFQANVTGTDVFGANINHAANFGAFRVTIDLDMMKIAGIDGEFLFSPVYYFGPNLGGQYLGVYNLTSSIAGPNSVRIDQLWYQQFFFDRRLKIKLGQVIAIEEFGGSPYLKAGLGDFLFFDSFINDALSYTPNVNYDLHQSFSPAGKPGVLATLDLRDILPGLYLKGGAFTAYRDPYEPDRHGFDYESDFNQGAVFAGEVGYQEQDTPYWGVYNLGFHISNQTGYTQLRTGEHLTGNYNVYATITKTVFHPRDRNGELDTTKGLDLQFQAFYEPDDRNDADFQSLFLLRYTGLVPGRDHDKVGLGFVYTHTSHLLSLANQDAGGPKLGSELEIEFSYNVHITPWLFIEPTVQAYYQPDGNSHRDPIVLLGIRSITIF